jgi:thiamine biosynthesis protein ThiS
LTATRDSCYHRGTGMVIAKGKPLEWHEKLTVREVLRILGYEFPLVLVRVNEQVVKKKDWESFVVPDGSTVEVQPIVAGG